MISHSCLMIMVMCVLVMEFQIFLRQMAMSVSERALHEPSSMSRIDFEYSMDHPSMVLVSLQQDQGEDDGLEDMDSRLRMDLHVLEHSEDSERTMHSPISGLGMIIIIMLHHLTHQQKLPISMEI